MSCVTVQSSIYVNYTLVDLYPSLVIKEENKANCLVALQKSVVDTDWCQVIFSCISFEKVLHFWKSLFEIVYLVLEVVN